MQVVISLHYNLPYPYRFFFQAEMFDGTWILNAYVEHKETEMLLGMLGEEIIEAKQKLYWIQTQFLSTQSFSYFWTSTLLIYNRKEGSTLTTSMKKLEGSQFPFQVRTSRN